MLRSSDGCLRFQRVPVLVRANAGDTRRNRRAQRALPQAGHPAFRTRHETNPTENILSELFSERTLRQRATIGGSESVYSQRLVLGRTNLRWALPFAPYEHIPRANRAFHRQESAEKLRALDCIEHFTVRSRIRIPSTDSLLQ